MDSIKSDTHLFDSMHFIDLPYQTGGDFEAPNPESMNALFALSEASKTLMFSREETGVWSKAFSLLLTVHVLGDIHQPLHAVSLFNDEFQPPTGDMGGNKWRITYEYLSQKYHQLHLLFDCVGGLWCDYMPHPVTDTYASNIKKLADEIEQDYPQSAFSDAELHPNFTSSAEFYDVANGWAYESFDLAKTAYDTYPLDGTITEETIQWSRTNLRRRIAMAGYRMAHVLAKVNTSIHNAPADTSHDLLIWRIATLSVVVIAIAFIILAIVTYRRGKDYQQLASSLRPSQSDDISYDQATGDF